MQFNQCFILQKHWASVYNASNIRNLTWYITAGNHDHAKNDGRENNEIGIYHGAPTWHFPKFAYNFTVDSGKFKASFSTFDTHVMYTKKRVFRKQKKTFLDTLSVKLKHPQHCWKIAWTHIPPYSSSAMYNVNSKLHDSIVGHFEHDGLDLHFAGHDHSLQHLKRKDVNYFISGAGSKPPYKYSKRANSILKNFGVTSVKFFRENGFIHVELSETVANVSFIGKLGNVMYNTIIKKRIKDHL